MSDFVSQFNFVWNTSELQQALAKLYSCQENWLSQLWISVSHINPHEGIFPCSSRFGIKHGQHFYHENLPMCTISEGYFPWQYLIGMWWHHHMI